VPRSIISFGFEDSFKDGFDEGLEAGAAFRGLTDTIGRMETFLLAGTEAEAGAGTGTETEAAVALAVEIAGTIVGTVAGTRGTETGTVVTLAVEIAGIVGTAGTEAGTIGIAEPIGARAGIGVALGTEALICARLNKNSR
jgi:hypothetical protein